MSALSTVGNVAAGSTATQSIRADTRTKVQDGATSVTADVVDHAAASEFSGPAAELELSAQTESVKGNAHGGQFATKESFAKVEWHYDFEA